MSARHVTQKRVESVARQLVDRDRAAVELVATLRIVSGRHVLRALYPDVSETSARSCRRMLARLVRWRVLARLERRVGGLGRGSDAWTYALDSAGQRLVRPGAARRPHLPSPAMWHHVLMGTEVNVALREHLRGGGRRLDLWEGEPSCWRRSTGADGAVELLKPDAYVRVTGGGYTDSFFLEMDTGSQARTIIRAKLSSYRRHHATGQEQARLDVFPQVVFVTETLARHAVLVDLIGELDPQWWPLFSVQLLGNVAAHLGGEA